MSIAADPLFVSAEVAYRRESLATGRPAVGTTRRHHRIVEGVLARTPRLHQRHTTARHA